MAEALLEAEKAFLQDEVPVGAVLVKEGKIIARAFNQVETSRKATHHAELLCIEKAAEILGDFRLIDCVLYTTLEPCLMCAGACVLSRIKKIVYAAKDLRHGACVSQYTVFEKEHPIHTPLLEEGKYAEESASLLRKFFKNKRQEKPCKGLS